MLRIWLPILSGLVLGVFALGYCCYAQRKLVAIGTESSRLFHQRFAAGQDDVIYREADSRFRDAISGESERGFFNRIRRKLGACTYVGPLQWVANSSTQGAFVTLRYRADCENGVMSESFTWRILDNEHRRARAVSGE